MRSGFGDDSRSYLFRVEAARQIMELHRDDPEELAIPGSPFGFRRLLRAQAAGDFDALRERGRRVARIRWEDL